MVDDPAPGQPGALEAHRLAGLRVQAQHVLCFKVATVVPCHLRDEHVIRIDVIGRRQKPRPEVEHATPHTDLANPRHFAVDELTVVGAIARHRIEPVGQVRLTLRHFLVVDRKHQTVVTDPGDVVHIGVGGRNERPGCQLLDVEHDKLVAAIFCGHPDGEVASIGGQLAAAECGVLEKSLDRYRHWRLGVGRKVHDAR